MTHREQFYIWWREDPERSKCFISQAVDAYIRSFPARVKPLLIEMLGNEEDFKKEQDGGPKTRRFFSGS